MIIRGGHVVTADSIRRADIRIEDGRIMSVEPDLPGAPDEIDATGLHVLPATIDVHLHFNEPGRTEWEGAATGSRALAAGGGAVFFDMPLNSTPCTVNAREFDRKRLALEASSIADFGIWGGLIPGNREEMAELADRGVVGFKAFMCDSGLPEFPRADDQTLLDGFAEAARLNLPVAVHAENDELVRDKFARRPVIAEVDAIQRASLFAAKTGVRLHIVHVSSGHGVTAAAEARARGADISIETCPHYLYFTEEDVERLGAVAKCAPPLRSRGEQQRLWTALLKGTIDLIASDHSPAPPEMKAGPFAHAWGGIAGVQSTLAVLLDRGYFASGLSLQRIAHLLAAMPARRFRIPRKGAICVGNDADLVLVDLNASSRLDTEVIAHRHRITPYAGEVFRGIVRRTMVRGETVFMDGEFMSGYRGQFIRPER